MSLNHLLVNSVQPKINIEVNDLIVDGELDVDTIVVNNFFVATGLFAYTGAHPNIGSASNPFNNLYITNITGGTGQINNLSSNQFSVNNLTGGTGIWNLIRFNGSNQANLSQYQSTGTVASWTGFTGLTGYNASSTVKYSVVGNAVNLTIGAFNSQGTNTGTISSVGSVLPTYARPGASISQPVLVLTNGGSNTNTGTMLIDTSGIFYLYSTGKIDSVLGGFAAGTNVGLLYDAAFCFSK
jgi:hypothetical protein